ncbi:ABC transporter ATP-binding protein [Halocatena marina]|uniref:ATP-binding cassette domain-containing protein n=1 Tax=Halocatena marina TaxID=2934937 RepID=A0ABD5YWV1_9EURY|nr:ATP-binding cassette domain-containing protein [Halocatena marina]
MTNTIVIEDVELTYSDGTEAVKGIDLEIPDGEFFGFLGPNGAGKTTTIKILATLLQPTAGMAEVNGFDAKTDPRLIRQSIGYMAQETLVDYQLTARENIRFACEAYNVPHSEREHRIEELLELTDLTDVADKRPDDFSGGMQKRLDAATALVHQPSLVFLDEPTTGLDPKARNRLWDYFRRINSEGTTIFLTTQYLEEADQLCDRIGIILDGEIIATGSPTELKQQVGGDILDLEIEDEDDMRTRAAEVVHKSSVFPDATIESRPDGLSVASRAVQNHSQDLLLELLNADVAITGFAIRTPTLDDVFLAITGEHIEDSQTHDDQVTPEVTQ